MKVLLFSVFWLCCGVTVARAADFEPPVRLTADGEAVRVDSPGYAAPCLADLNGDGKKELLVGQFANGHIRVFKSEGDLTFAKGEFLKAEGEVAEVPGVW